jgi:hypothetical protein
MNTRVMVAAVKDAFHGRLISVSVRGHRVPLVGAFQELFYCRSVGSAERMAASPGTTDTTMVEVVAPTSIKREHIDEDDRGSAVTTIRTLVQFRGATPDLFLKRG